MLSQLQASSAAKSVQLLRKAHKDLLDRISPPKSVDPLTVLPHELAEVILEYLSFSQRMIACLVSKQWTHFIRSIPSLWRHLDLSGSRKKVKNAFISRAINIGRNKLTAATLSNLDDFNKTIGAIVKHCPLQELTLLECGLQSSNLTCSLAGAKTLKKLRLGQFSPSELPQLLQVLSERLELFECYHLYTGGFPDFRGLHCGNLSTLYLTCNIAADAQTLFSTMSEHFPALQSLTLHQTRMERWPRLQIVIHLERCTRLQLLDLRFALSRADQLRPPESLVSLKFVSMAGVAEKFFQHPTTANALTWYLPKLQELTLEAPSMPVNFAVHTLSDLNVQVLASIVNSHKYVI